MPYTTTTRGIAAAAVETHRRVIYGDTPHRFRCALADLIHNLTIAHNLASGRAVRHEMPWSELYDG